MEDITVNELKERLAKGENFHFFDVREAWEYEEDNLGANNIPLGELAHQFEQLDNIKHEEIVIHCRSGARSGNAKLFMMESEFTNVRNLIGGMVEWRTNFE
jgi:rhodanese-related sulfurtransferase